MRTVLLDATPPRNDACRQGADALRRALSDCGCQVESFPLAELPMAPCRGCFACWTDTPGRCPVQDASELAARAVIASGLTAVFSPVRFGVWSWQAKKALDRMICLISPHFEAASSAGPTRHTARYRSYPVFLGVGWLPGPDPEAVELFTRLVERNAWNFRSPAWDALVLDGDRPWAAQREACLKVLAGLGVSGGKAW
ncbi:flavodoxin family protein [Fundidesulfovibrio terrae]|uniref:flavodoxin family protein n=1 Tax=Fundidesulfovibrio terrae TaxID=2922866 RepID=UPI001FAEA3A0|nr:NAD(P)H-dependent oxidoreductase [Fundidesulfovibrio terrae]